MNNMVTYKGSPICYHHNKLMKIITIVGVHPDETIDFDISKDDIKPYCVVDYEANSFNELTWTKLFFLVSYEILNLRYPKCRQFDCVKQSNKVWVDNNRLIDGMNTNFQLYEFTGKQIYLGRNAIRSLKYELDKYTSKYGL